MSLNISQYPCYALIICSDHAMALNMPYILHIRQAFEDASSSECGTVIYMQGLHRILNISEYRSKCLNNVRTYINMP